MQNDANQIASFGPFRLLPAQRLLLRDGAPVIVGTRAFDILVALVQNHSQVLTHRDLLERVWTGLTVEESNLRVHLSSLRKILGDGQEGVRYIENLVGRGYCFVAPVQWSRDTKPSGEQPTSQESVTRAKRRALPTKAPRVFGRKETIDELCDLLLSQKFVTIVGSGGIGKTTVAVSIAHVLLEHFHDTPLFIDLGEIRDPELVLQTIASAAGVSAAPSQLGDNLAAHLSRHKTLLILDNCEHLIDIVAHICENIFRDCTDLYLLATSREALRVGHEQVYFLEPLEVPEDHAGLTIAEAMAYPSVQLFLDKASTGGFREPLQPEGVTLIVRMCRRLDGNALAIELVASRVGTFGLEGTYDLFEQHHKLLWKGRRNAPARHQTLEAMLNWSYDLLAERDRDVLQYLSVFAGPFTLKAAQAVAADPDSDRLAVANSLTSLVDKSLVWVSTQTSPVLFKLLDTTSIYAGQKLCESGRLDGLCRRHALYWLECLEAEAIDTSIFSGRDLTKYLSYTADVRAALEWSRRHLERDAALFVKLAAASAPLFLAQGLLGECETWCKAALAGIADAELGPTVELALQEALAIASMFTRGNHAVVRQSIHRGLELAGSLNMIDHQLHLLAGENIFLTRTGDYQSALEGALQCAVTSTAKGTASALAMADWMIGCVHHLMGDQRKAQLFTERGMERAPAASPTDVDFFGYDHRVRAMIVLCRTLWLRGYPKSAAAMSERAIAEADRRRHSVTICIALIYTATEALWSQNHAAAAKRIDRLIIHAQSHALAPYQMVGIGLSGQLKIATGEIDEGIAELNRALASLQSEEHHILTPAFMGAMARGLCLRGDLAAANTAVYSALQMAEATGGHCDLPELLLVAGDVVRCGSGGETEEAAAFYVRALEVARTQAALHQELRAAIELVGLKRMPSRELAEICSRFPEKGSVFVTIAHDMLRNLSPDAASPAPLRSISGPPVQDS